MKCPKCGKEVAAGTKFCIGCGSPLPQEEPKASDPAPAPKPVKVELPDESGVIQDKGTLIFWLTLLCGSTNIHHFMLAKTGGPLDKKSRFVFNWEGLVTVAFAVLALIITVASQSAVVGTVLLGMLSIAAFVHAWRHAFGKIYSYDHTHHYMGQKWKKVVCIVHASVTVISIILGLVLSVLAPSATAKANLSIIPPTMGAWVTLQEASVAEMKKTGDFTAIGFEAPSSDKVAFFDIPSGKRKDIHAVGALLLEAMSKCQDKTTLVTSLQMDPRNGETHKFCWVGLRNAESGNFEEMPAEQVEECLALIPTWKSLCDAGLVQKFDDLFPAPLFEPLDMSEISGFMDAALKNEPQYETGDGPIVSGGVAKFAKIKSVFAPNAQEIDSKTFQTENFVFKETTRNKKKDVVVWTATSLRPIDQCPEGSTWKITASVKRIYDYNLVVNYGYTVKSPEGCPKVKDIKQTVYNGYDF
jgi:hypothetical protein